MTQTNLVALTITSQDVVLIMKGEPGNSPCGFSNRLVLILDHTGISYTTHDILTSDPLRSGTIEETGVCTFPQLFIHGIYEGGSDDIRAMHEAEALIACKAAS